MDNIKVGDLVRIKGERPHSSGYVIQYNGYEGKVISIHRHELGRDYCRIELKAIGCIAVIDRLEVWLDECELVEKRNKVYGIAIFMAKGVTKC